MCTVLFIPLEISFCFVSLRDEDPSRSRALGPQLVNNRYVAPIDTLAGGTWTGADRYGNVIILLNGGFTAHRKKSRYAGSRGLVVTRLLESELPVLEWTIMDLAGTEPFTLVVWSGGRLYELVWDGEQKHRAGYDHTTPQIWSSCTLYDTVAREQRKTRFTQWMNTMPEINRQTLMQFFSLDKDQCNGFLINRDEKVRTLSYTCIDHYPGWKTTLHYAELDTGKEAGLELKLFPAGECCLHQPVTHYCI